MNETRCEPARRIILLATLILVTLATLAATGCQSQQQLLQQKAPTALQTAEARGRFDLNCPTAKASILSQEYVQPAVQGPWFGGVQRAEYPIGVEGCGKKQVYIILCQDGSVGCFAAGEHDNQPTSVNN